MVFPLVATFRWPRIHCFTTPNMEGKEASSIVVIAFRAAASNPGERPTVNCRTYGVSP